MRGLSDGGGRNHRKITDRQLGITKDLPFVALSPFPCCSPLTPAHTTIFVQHKTANVPFAGLRCYGLAEVCEEASQSYCMFVLHTPHCNCSLLPPWKLLLILITLLLGTLQLPSNITLESKVLLFLKDGVSLSHKLTLTGIHYYLYHGAREPVIKWTQSWATPSLCMVKEVPGKGGFSCALWRTVWAVGGERSWSPAAPAWLSSAEQTDVAGVRMGACF